MRHSTVRGAALAAAVAVVAAACGPLIPTPTGSPLNAKQPSMAEFDRNLATWQASGITRYAFTFEPSCFCSMIPHLVLSDGTEIRIDGVTVDGSVPPPLGTPVGVDGLFDIVRRAIKGDRATIAYDSSTGVPLTLDSDPVANEVDDEFSFQVNGWTLQPPDDHVLGTIATAQRNWTARNLRTYTWSIEVACDCFFDGRRFDITVKNGEPTVRFRGKPVLPEDLDGVPVTVPAFFDLVTRWAVLGKATVAFDDERGYLTRARVRASGRDDVQSETIDVVAFSVP